MINVLISTYNGEKYIVEQLESIRNQSEKDYHIYIRDDGSTDNTIQRIREFVERTGMYDLITIEEGDNIGFCKSFFWLLESSKAGDYWAFCDQDDLWMPDKLKLASDWMRKQDEHIPLLYHSGFAVGNEDLSHTKPYPRSEFKYQFYNSITSNIFFGFSVVINGKLRELLLKAEPANIKYHDWFAGMITAAFGKYHMSGQIEAIHRQYSTNASPLYFFKKIPHGFRLMSGERFYTAQAAEFARLFGESLSEEDREILTWFQKGKYNLRTACRKAFYNRRWNPQLKVELILRLLMLVGVI